MTNKEQYQHAMAKVSPSADWIAATQQRIASERFAGQNAAPAKADAPAAAQKPPLYWKRFAPYAAAAAALVLIAVPVLRQTGAQNSAEFSLFSAGEPQLSAKAADNSVMASDAVAEQFDAAAPASAPAAADAGKGAESPALPLVLPVALSLPDQQPLRASNITQLFSANPTYRLDSAQLPTTLPVYFLPSDATAHSQAASYLERAADAMGCGLYLEDGLLLGNDHSASGFLMDSAHWNPEQSILTQGQAKQWRAEADGYTLSLYPAAAIEAATAPSNLQQIKAFDAEALAQYGGLLSLSYPAYQPPIANMGYSGEVTYLDGSHFYYERGNAEDDIATQLKHYCFQRLLAGYDASGTLLSLQYQLLPQGTSAQYPLRSLQNALKAGVEAVNAALDGQSLLADSVTAADVVAWQLEYATDTTAGVVYPVYTFTAAVTPTTDATVNGYDVYIQYSVPALAMAYRNEADAQLSILTNCLQAISGK